MMNFAEALVLMKAGYKVARSDWNGSGMWICQGAGTLNLGADSFWNEHTKAFAVANGGTATVDPYFIMKTAQNTIQMGWQPSQADLLAIDWVEVK